MLIIKYTTLNKFKKIKILQTTNNKVKLSS